MGLLYTGALNEGRGIETALAAMRRLDGVHLWLAGEGDLSEPLRRLAAEHRLPENALVVVENAAGLPDFLVPLETVTARNLYSLDGTIAQHICRVRLAR